MSLFDTLKSTFSKNSDNTRASKNWSKQNPKEKANANFKRNKLKVSEISWLLSQLATTQLSGITSYKALGMVSSMRQDAVGRKASQMQESLAEGLTLSQSIAKHIPESGSLIRALITAGEASGGLELALRRAADLLETRVRLKRKIRAALTYPTMVVLVTATLITILLVVVVPKFEEIYNSTGGELPGITKTVIKLSESIPLLTAVLLLITAFFLYITRRAVRDEKIAKTLDEIKMKVPVFGNLVRKGAVARVSTSLASLIGSGVTITEALALSAETSGSTPYKIALLNAKEKVGEGKQLSQALSQSPLFPVLMIQLIEVGEETGSLVSILEKYAKTTAEDLESTSESITRLVEPVLMVFVGLIVAVFVLALYMPIINLGQQFR
ncbi:MAG: type II secretion system F family protein [Candidatus Paceibacterota bacterium]